MPEVVLGASQDTYVRRNLDLRINDNYGFELNFGVGTGRGGDSRPIG
ncbi:MAG: hypothetical protein F6K09_35520 [Merismopedia sp. SIO2A8]|nr:hypothetical protein [Merismopedia sp. SIO2A8]